MPFHFSRGGKAYLRLTTKTAVVEPKTLLAWRRLQNINLSLLWFSVLFPSKQGSSKNFTCTHMCTYFSYRMILLMTKKTVRWMPLRRQGLLGLSERAWELPLLLPRWCSSKHTRPRGKRTAELSTFRTPQTSCTQQGMSPSQPPAKTPH